jgi:hypothetical protein
MEIHYMPEATAGKNLGVSMVVSKYKKALTSAGGLGDTGSDPCAASQ